MLRARARVKSSAGPSKWSKSVRTWVVEFQNRDRDESLPAFDSLFKKTQPRSNELGFAEHCSLKEENQYATNQSDSY